MLIFSRKFSYEFYVFRGDVVHKPKSHSNPIASFYQSFCIRNYLTLTGSKKMLRTTL